MKRAYQLGLSLLVTLAASWWTYTRTNGPQMWVSLKSANYAWVAAYFGVLAVIHVARTLRWGFLLSGLERVPFRKLNEASGIGFMMLVILPFRLGEFARPFLIAQRSSIRRSVAMTTVVLERIVDGLTIAVMMRVLLFFVPTETESVTAVKWGSNLLFGVFGGGLAFLLYSLKHQARTVEFVRRTVGRWVPGVADKVADVVDGFVGGMRQLPGWKAQVGFFFCTAVYWGVNGLGMAMLSRAFGCDGGAEGCQPFSLTVFQAFVVMSVLVVGLMIPAAPGSAGTFQLAVGVGLSLFMPESVVASSGQAYAHVLWLSQFFQQVGYGVLLMVLGHLSFREIASKLDKEQQAAAPTP